MYREDSLFLYTSVRLVSKILFARPGSFLDSRDDRCFSNIDVRIQQAELEYRLGREELELLTLHEESRALQAALELAETQEKQKNDTIFRYASSSCRYARLNFCLRSINICIAPCAIHSERHTNVDGVVTNFPPFYSRSSNNKDQLSRARCPST